MLMLNRQYYSVISLSGKFMRNVINTHTDKDYFARIFDYSTDVMILYDDARLAVILILYLSNTPFSYVSVSTICVSHLR